MPSAPFPRQAGAGRKRLKRGGGRRLTSAIKSLPGRIWTAVSAAAAFPGRAQSESPPGMKTRRSGDGGEVIRAGKGGLNRRVRKTTAPLEEAKEKTDTPIGWLKGVKAELAKPPTLNDLPAPRQSRQGRMQP